MNTRARRRLFRARGLRGGRHQAQRHRRQQHQREAAPISGTCAAIDTSAMKKKNSEMKASGCRAEGLRGRVRTHSDAGAGRDEVEFHRVGSGGLRLGAAMRTRSVAWARSRSTRSKCVGSCGLSSAASRGRCKSHRRESQKRSARGAQHAPAAGARSAPAQRAHARRRRRAARRRARRRARPVARSMHQSFRHDGDVEEPGVDAGEVEVEHAGQPWRVGVPSNITLSRNRSAWIGAARQRRVGRRCGDVVAGRRARSRSSARLRRRRGRAARPARSRSTRRRPRRLGWLRGKSRAARCMRASSAPTLGAVRPASGARSLLAAAGGRRPRRGLPRIERVAARSSPVAASAARLGHRQAALAPGASSGCR